MFLFISLETQR